MKVAIWIIAIVEIIRMLQNCIQIIQIKKANSNPQFERATNEFIKSLNKTDSEFMEQMLEQLKKGNENEHTNCEDCAMWGQYDEFGEEEVCIVEKLKEKKE